MVSTGVLIAVAVGIALVVTGGATYAAVSSRSRAAPVGEFVPPSPVDPAAVKPWTLLIFLNGNNNLDDFGTQNVEAMKRANNPNVNIVVQWASGGSQTVTRNLVSYNHIETIETLNWSSTDMGSYLELQEFLLWGIQRYPAQHYFVDVWNHGNGWAPAISRDISVDDHTGNAISPQQLGAAIAAASQAIGRKIDVYGSDACLMAMIEVYAEMLDSVDYAVGSQELEPGEGWPYYEWIQSWGATPRDVAVNLATLYTASTPNVTLSVVDMSLLNSLVDAMGGLGAAIKTTPAGVVPIIEQAISMPAYPDNVDIGSFVQGYNPNTPASQAVATALENCVIYTRGTGLYTQFTGLNVWMPTQNDANLLRVYKTLAFDQRTLWSQAIEAYLLARRRRLASRTRM